MNPGPPAPPSPLAAPAAASAVGAYHHALLLLPRFSLLALAAAQEALAAANELLDDEQHRCSLLSLDGAPVCSGSGVWLPVQAAAGDTRLSFNCVWLFADHVAELDTATWQTTLHGWLQQQARRGALLAGIGTGAALLAQAGLLDGYRATLHWAFVAELTDSHPAVVFSSNVYEIDRQRLSCGAGTASLDLLIAWLGSQHGERVGQGLVAHFGLERLRARDERQRAPLSARVGGGSAKLTEAVALMEANLSEPLPTEDIARLVGVSRRQLERLFKQHLNELPSRYYGELRLSRAQRLLRQSSQSILQVGLACGFTSGSHFSNAYRGRFGRTPREERGSLLAAKTAAPRPAGLTPAPGTASASASLAAAVPALAPPSLPAASAPSASLIPSRSAPWQELSAP